MVTNKDDNLRMAQQQGQVLPPFLKDAVGPNFNIPGQHDRDLDMGSYQLHEQDVHPALFGQEQFKDGFGPVYATPSFPPNYGPSQGAGTFPGYQQDMHPALFGQGQFIDGFGPVYATPSFPPNYGPSHGTGVGPWHPGQGQISDDHWQQGQGYPHAMVPCYWQPVYMYPSFGHQYYQQ